MPVGPNRAKTPQRIVLRIDEVDIPNRAVHGYDKSNVLVVATFRETPNGIINIPAQNERWIAAREGMGQWRLVGRLDSAADQSWIEDNLGPGDMRIKATNIWFTGTVHGGGFVNSVTAGDASIVVGGTATDPTIKTADIHTISLLHATAGDVSMNSHKITNLTAGVASTDAANVGQIPTTLPPSGSAGGDLTGSYPNPTIKASVGLTGSPTSTTPLTADNSTRIATTAYVQAQGYVTSSTAPVTSVFTRTGAVVAVTGDYSLTQINKGTQHRLVISGASTLGDFPAGSSGQLLQSAGSSADPTWTTATYPATAGTAGNVPRSDGTNFVSTQLAAADLSNGTTGSGAVVLAAGSPAFSGTPTSTTPATGDNSTRIATTAFVQTAVTGNGPKITASALSGGPPGSPANGDIWIATGVNANGTVWHFRYNSGSASAYKWEFVGGAPFMYEASMGFAYTLGTLLSSGWYYWNQPGLSIFQCLRAGEYIVTGHSNGLYNGTAGQEQFAFANVTTNSPGAGRVDFHLDATNNYAAMSSIALMTVAANDTIGPVWSGSGSWQVQMVGWTVTPRRIS